MKTLNDASVDSVVTETMKVCADTCYEVHRVLKPGGHIVVLTSKHIYHRLAAQIEDAGFEIRDQIIWLDQDDIHPCVVARKPLEGNVAENVLKYGVGGINVDGCRIAVDHQGNIFAKNPHTKGGFGHAGAEVYGRSNGSDVFDPSKGRWPANVIHDGSDKVEEAFAAFGTSKDGVAVQRNGGGQKIGGNGIYGGSEGLVRDDMGFGSKGTASRFFYRAKSSSQDRGGSKHLLMSYLCKLVTPPGGVILDPFVGSGTTVQAAEGNGFIFTRLFDEDVK